MNCESCGAEIQDEIEECPECGALTFFADLAGVELWGGLG